MPNFNWGSLEKMYNEFPRVIFRNVVIYRKLWIVRLADILVLLKGNYEYYIKYFINRGIPTVFILNDGDEDMLLNICRYQDFEVFKDEIRNRKVLRIYENLSNSNKPNEIIIPTYYSPKQS